jgi:hypothetical protein
MVGLWGLGDVIMAAKKRWQSDATTSYRRGTEKDGVQQSEELTVTAQEKLWSYFFNLVSWFDLMLRALRLGEKKPS